jgi:hypothetical protein
MCSCRAGCHSPHENLHLQLIPACHIIHGMQRLMNVPNEVNGKFQGLGLGIASGAAQIVF